MKHSIRLIILSIFAICFFSNPSYSDDKVTIAVLDLNSKGVPKIVANAVSDIIRAEFVNIGNFTVVERSQMNAILDEQGLQMTGCTDASCAVQFGKLLSARRIVVGEITKIGQSIMITARYVDVQKGSSLFSAKEKAASVEVIDKSAEKLAKDLARRIIEGDKEILTPITKKGYYTRAIVPGWGHVYAEKPVRGYVIMGGFVLSAAITAYTIFDYSKKRSDYLDLPAGTEQSEFNSKYDDAKLSGNIAFGAVCLTSLVYIYNWVDALFISTPEFEEPVAFNDNSSTGGLCFDIFSGNSFPDNTGSSIYISAGIRL